MTNIKKGQFLMFKGFGHKKILTISYFNITAIVGVKVFNFCVRDDT